MAVSPRSIFLLDPLPKCSPGTTVAQRCPPYQDSADHSHHHSLQPPVLQTSCLLKDLQGAVSHPVSLPVAAQCPLQRRAVRTSDGHLKERLTGLLVGLGQLSLSFQPNRHTTSEQSLKAHDCVLSLMDHSQSPAQTSTGGLQTCFLWPT